MAIPEYPITRREQYLDAIATNDTSVLPAEPITRTEQYLDAIARNAGGGGSGGGVEIVYLDLMSNNDKGYAIYNDFIFVAETGETIMPNHYGGTVYPGEDVIMGFPKFGNGAVLIALDSLFDMSTVDFSVAPVTTGGVELTQGGLRLTSDGTIAFNGKIDD